MAIMKQSFDECKKKIRDRNKIEKTPPDFPYPILSQKGKSISGQCGPWLCQPLESFLDLVQRETCFHLPSSISGLIISIRCALTTGSTAN
jgi:hypothetical protein